MPLTKNAANPALDNLAATTAINSSLLPATNNTVALGSTSKMWSDIFLASGAILNFNNGETTLSQSAGGLNLNTDLAVNGGDLITSAATATLFNTNATTLSIGGAATTMTIGATTGITTIRNQANHNSIAGFNSYINLQTGNNNGAKFFGVNQASAGGNKTMLFSGAADDQQIVFGSFTAVNAGRDFDHAAPSTPTFFFHSDEDPDTDNTEWGSFTHDGINVVHGAGKGAIIKDTVTAGITASTTQSQGQGALTSNVNQVSTVANANDTVTLPAAPSVGSMTVTIINDGANTLQVFPASGDNLGAGADASTTITAGATKMFVSYDATNWEAFTL